jgi:pre-mRNA-splicing factor ATP-dependent RNA helicase DHX15/PRP43
MSNYNENKSNSKSKKSLQSHNSLLNSGNITANIGLEDPQGLNLNPLNNKLYSPRYSELSKIWTSKLVYTNRHLLYDAIKSSQVILAVAMTGTGKSIIIPRIALHAFDYKEKIICCIPKRIPTLNNATFVAKCMDVNLGEECGYYYQGTNMTNKNGVESKLIFTTTGSLISRMTGNDPTLADYKCIIIDEAHERSVQNDQLLLLLKRLCLKRRDLKIIIMSATINLETFRDYFPKSKYKFAEVEAGVQLSYHVSEKWLDKSPDDWKKTAVNITMNILKMTSIGDILIFVKSGGDANQVCMQLEKAMADFRKQLANKKSSSKTRKHNSQTQSNTKSANKVIPKVIPKEYQINPLCIKLEGASNALDQKIATDVDYYKTLKDVHGYPYTRKIICSTNVAESSLTVDGVVFVIDSGYEYEESYDPNSRVRSLLENHIAQSAVKQRKGRAGRTQPGYCFHLYTKKDQEGFQDYPTPSIEKSDITNDILDLMRLPEASTVKTVRSLLDEFISPPHEKFILNSLRTLHALGAITNIHDAGSISPLGYALARFRSIKVNHARALIAAHFYGVSRSVCDIIALAHETDGMLELIFQEFRPDKKKKPDANKREMQRWMSIMKGFAHPLGDYMTLLKAYRMYLKVAAKLPTNEEIPDATVDMLGEVDINNLEEQEPNPEDIKQSPSVRKWCKEHYINANRMSRVRFMSKQLYFTLQQIVRPMQPRNPKEESKRKSKLEKQDEQLEQDLDSNMTEIEIPTPESIRHSRISKIPDSSKQDLEISETQEGGFMQRIHAQEAINKLEANVSRFATEDENIMMSLGIGNFVNFAIRSKQADNVYVSCFAQTKKFAKINQDSFLVAHTKSKLPNIIMYDEMFQSSHEARFMKLNLVNRIPDQVFTRIKEQYGVFIKYCS